jgi:hypothetical protein
MTRVLEPLLSARSVVAGARSWYSAWRGGGQLAGCTTTFTARSSRWPAVSACSASSSR